jgi:hypothetical protein
MVINLRLLGNLWIDEKLVASLEGLINKELVVNAHLIRQINDKTTLTSIPKRLHRSQIINPTRLQIDQKKKNTINYIVRTLIICYTVNVGMKIKTGIT